MSDDYLFDRSGTPDPDVVRLERMLGRHCAEGHAHDRIRARGEDPQQCFIVLTLIPSP